MIKNVIFDFGNVLATFDPMAIAAKYAESREDAALLASAIFDERWADYDGGRVTFQEHLSGSLAKLPARLHESATRLFSSWHGDLCPIDATAELIETLYRRGYGLYILSNAPVEFSSKARQNYPVTEWFDGAVYSAEIKMDKPHPPIYHHLLTTYGLDPDECLFIDDKPVNIEGAQACGIRGVVYDGGSTQPILDVIEQSAGRGVVDHARLAKRLFTDGCNCAQAVLLAFGDKTGLDEKTAMMLSSSFGGGMGRMREVCGAVSGMLMALGALCGYDAFEPDANLKKAAHYAHIQELCGRFRRENGSIICRELLEGHVKKTGNNGEQTDAMRSNDPTPTPRSEEYYQKRPCGELVEMAARLLEAYLVELDKEG